MNTLTISSLLCTFIAIAFSVVTATKSLKDKRYLWFSILCMLISIWSLFNFFSHILYSHLFGKLHLLMTLVLAPTCVYFFLQFTEKIKEEAPTFFKTLTGIYAAGILLATGFFLPPEKLFWFKHATNIYAISVIGYAFFLLSLNLKEARLGVQESKRQLSLILGGCLTLFMLTLDGLSQEGLPLPAFGNVALMIYLFFIYQIITRRKILDLEDLVAKGVLLFVLAAILTLIYVILVSWVEGPALFLFNTFVASFVILILFEPAKTIAGKMTYAFFLKRRLKTEEQLDNLRNRFIEISDLQDLTHEVLVGLKNILKISRADFFLLDLENMKLKLIQSLESDPSKIKISEILIGHDFVKYLQRKFPFPITTHSIQREILEGVSGFSKDRLKNVLNLFDALHAECAFGFMLEGKLLGFCSFINEKAETPYSLNELKLLIPLSKQIAYSLNHLEVYDKIRERDRLATVGEMAAGLAHEIKNPLGAIKGAAQYLLPSPEKSYDNLRQNEFLKIIVDEVDRLNKVVTQFLNYAKPFQHSGTETQLKDLVKKSIQTISSDIPSNINITLEAEESLPTTYVDPEQLNQVFLNLILNAAQAMPDGGHLKISVRHMAGAKEAIQMIFEDSGMGISTDNMKRLFIPFFTTKDHGTGLGLPICQKIIKAHMGTIDVESEPKKGTKFIVTLPIKKS